MSDEEKQHIYTYSYMGIKIEAYKKGEAGEEYHVGDKVLSSYKEAQRHIAKQRAKEISKEDKEKIHKDFFSAMRHWSSAEDIIRNILDYIPKQAINEGSFYSEEPRYAYRYWCLEGEFEDAFRKRFEKEIIDFLKDYAEKNDRPPH